MKQHKNHGSQIRGSGGKYDRFRDRVNSFFSRAFSKSYRDQFNTWKNSDEVYTIGKRAGSPSLISGGLQYTCPEDMCNHEITYDRTGAIGNVVPDVSLTVSADGTMLGQRQVTRNYSMDFQRGVDVNTPGSTGLTATLRKVVPGTRMSLDAKNYPDFFSVTDGVGATVFANISLVDPTQYNFTGVGITAESTGFSSGAGGRMTIQASSTRPWARTDPNNPGNPVPALGMPYSNWSVTYSKYTVRLPRIRLTIE